MSFAMVNKMWNWFWYRPEKVSYRMWIDDDRYIGSASNEALTVYNYGSTPEMAKEAALFKLQQALKKKEKKERKFITRGNGYVLYRIK